MGSKGIKRALLAMVGMFLILVLVITATNWDMVKQKLGIAKTQEGDETADGEMENGGQIGDDLSAFVRDETFFDPEVRFKSIEMYAGKKVSMVAASVAGELRILILDSVGQPVTGAKFTVEVQGVGEYTDDDEDGIICIDRLKPGEYSVSMQEMKGYSVPDSVTSIQVTDRTEYKMLDYVEYLIQSEENVDAAAEDTAVNLARENADGTEDTQLKRTDGSARLGLDVSSANGTIDWEQVKNQGIEYAMIRVGYRGAATGALIEDSHFEENIQGAIEAGIPVGVYFFTQAENETEAVEEASMVLKLIRKYDVDYPVFLLGSSAGKKARAEDLRQEERTAAYTAFFKTIAGAGYETGLLAQKDWLEQETDSSSLSDYNIWLSEYSEVPDYGEYYSMWQYTSQGSVEGIDGNVNLDLCYMKIDTSVNHAGNAEGYSGVVNGDTGNVPE